MPDENAARFAHVEPAARRGVEPRPPFRALRRAGTVPRHADTGEGTVPRRLVRRLAGRRWPRSASARSPSRRSATSPARRRGTGPTVGSTRSTRTATASATSPTRPRTTSSGSGKYWMTTGDRDAARRALPRRTQHHRLRRARDRPEDRARHQPARRRRRLPRRHRRLAAEDALRLRHEHRGAHDDERARGRRLPAGRRRWRRRSAGPRPRSSAQPSARRSRLTARSASGSTRPDGVFVDGLAAERHAEHARVATGERVARSRSASCRPRTSDGRRRHVVGRRGTRWAS